MSKNDYVECVTPDNGMTHYSKKNPSRCVREMLFGDFVMYAYNGAMGVQKGYTNHLGAWKWLSGCELSEIEHYKLAS